MSSDVVQRLRVGAYGLCRRDDRVLLTRLSERTSRPGAWTLPGGGIDHGEAPQDAVLREVHEETGLRATVSHLLTVESSRRTSADDAGTCVDLHTVHIIYAIDSVDETSPTVLDVGGSSDLAAWVPVAEVAGMDTVDMVQAALQAAATINLPGA